MRAKSGAPRHQRTKKIRGHMKGAHRGWRRTRTAKTAILRSMRYGFFHRKRKKRDYRALWIVRINGALESRDLAYSRFMYGLKKANVALNRKALSELAISDAPAFDRLVELARQHA